MKDGYTFAGWFSDTALTSAWDFSGDTVSGDITLYAKWTQVTYTVTFNANGGEGTMEPQTVFHGVAAALSPNAFSREDNTFAGWNTSADGTGTPYADGATVTLTGNLALYAQWTTQELYTVTGTVKQGGEAVSGANVRLVRGKNLVAVTVTDESGAFSISAPDGTYNIIMEKNGTTKTTLVSLRSSQRVDVPLPTEQVNSVLMLIGEDTPNVMAGGLDDLAAALSSGEGAVTVTMTVEAKAASSDGDSDAIQAIATSEHPNQTLENIEIKVEKTTAAGTETLTETSSVLEIVIPYNFRGREYVTVYRNHGGTAQVLEKSTGKTDGTYQTDTENGLLYIYSNKFSTYSIGYTQCYNLKGSIKYGSFTGEVTLSLLDEKKALVQYTTINMSSGLGGYSFTHIPKGTYYLSAQWLEDSREVALENKVNVG